MYRPLELSSPNADKPEDLYGLPAGYGNALLDPRLHHLHGKRGYLNCSDLQLLVDHAQLHPTSLYRLPRGGDPWNFEQCTERER